MKAAFGGGGLGGGELRGGELRGGEFYGGEFGGVRWRNFKDDKLMYVQIVTSNYIPDIWKSARGIQAWGRV